MTIYELIQYLARCDADAEVKVAIEDYTEEFTIHDFARSLEDGSITIEINHKRK